MKQVLKKNGEKKYTWQDYLTWPDDERWEVIDGEAYDMTPSPTAKHQRIVTNFSRILGNKITGGPCATFVAPLDLYLDDFNFVQPDIMVICDEKKIKDKVYGPPDLIIEVLSPSTSLKDKREKKVLYEKFEVREYIIVHPGEMFIERYCLEKGKYKGPDMLGTGDILKLSSLEGVEVSLWKVFEVEPPVKDRNNGVV